MYKRIAYYTMFNGFFFFMIWAGFIAGEQGAINISVFIAWFLFTVSLFSMTETSIDAGVKIGNHPVPAFIDVSLDVLAASVFVWNGFIFTGIAYVIHMFMCIGYREKVKERLLNKECKGA